MSRGAAFESLLYREPRLYELVFPDVDAVDTLVRAAIDRHLPAPPRSVLDVGCGSGQHLEVLARTIPDCWGVDLLESNVAYARATRPGITFRVGDMRTVRLGRTFDLVTCLGNTLSYALTDGDLNDTVTMLAAHAHRGTLVIADPLNARAYLDGDGFQERIEGRVDTPEFQATSVSVHTLDRDARILTRRRTWRIAGRPDVEDHARYRLLLPDEIPPLLEAHGFEMLGTYDNRQLHSTDLTGTISVATPDVGGLRGRKLYVLAHKR